VLNERPWGTPPPDAGPADGGTGQDLDGGTGPQVGLATVGSGGGGCASGGPQLAWLAVPLLALAFTRRLRTRRGPGSWAQV